MQKLIPILILLAACAAPPVAPTPVPSSDLVEAPEHWGGLDVVVGYLEIKLDADLPDPPPIDWYEGIWMRTAKGDVLCLFYRDRGDRCFEGRYFPPDTYEREAIHLAYHPDVVDTDRVHQITHWALWHATGHTDEQHCDPVWPPSMRDPGC